MSLPFNELGEPLMTDAQYRYANSLDDERDFDEERYWADYQEDDDPDWCSTCDSSPCSCPPPPAGGEFALFAAQGQSQHPTKDEAIRYAREVLHAESFEVYDADDRQVFCERPAARWV